MSSFPVPQEPGGEIDTKESALAGTSHLHRMENIGGQEGVYFKRSLQRKLSGSIKAP